MASTSLDEVDRGILHALQQEARRTTADEMAEALDVSASTIRNRIKRMEQSGVIEGYHPDINYERAGFQLHIHLICRAPPDKRSEFASAALDITGVVNVREMLTGTNNLHIEAIAVDSDTVDSLTEQVANLGLEIDSLELVKRDHTQPFNHFGPDVND